MTNMGVLVGGALTDSGIFVVNIGSGFRERVVWTCGFDGSEVGTASPSPLQAMMAKSTKIQLIAIIFPVIDLGFKKPSKISPSSNQVHLSRAE